MSQTRFRPVYGAEETIVNLAYQEGYLYFATDSGKIFLDADGKNKKLMSSVGSGAGVVLHYGNDSDPQQIQDSTDDTLYTFSAEYRRLPIKVGVSLKYVLDSLTDAFQVIQQTFVQQAFINKFNITYLGQTIGVTYKIPDNYEAESMIEFDGATLEDKNRKISMDLEVETNIPIIYKDTIIPSDAYVKGFVLGIELPGDRETINIEQNETSGL